MPAWYAVGMGAFAGEQVDVVDEADRVVDVVSRVRMRAENLRHRSVAIAVFASDGRLLVHRRSDAKDVWPGRWDVCVGGVVAAGESYDEAAARELAEEVGVAVEALALRFVADGRYEDDDVRTIARLYVVEHDGPYHFADGEVSEARLVTPAELRVLASVESFLPDSWSLALPHLGPFAAAGA
jgi:isopentenyldiphosphate isomerase